MVQTSTMNLQVAGALGHGTLSSKTYVDFVAVMEEQRGEQQRHKQRFPGSPAKKTNATSSGGLSCDMPVGS